MSVHHVVLVHHDASVEVLPAADFRPNVWLLRTYAGGVTRAFQRDQYAIAHCSDDDQEGTLVYAERPVVLYHQERDQEIRYRNVHANRVDDMPEVGVPVSAQLPEDRAVRLGREAVLHETRDGVSTVLHESRSRR